MERKHQATVYCISSATGAVAKSVAKKFVNENFGVCFFRRGNELCRWENNGDKISHCEGSLGDVFFCGLLAKTAWENRGVWTEKRGKNYGKKIVKYY
jgi:hypothetical protein